MSQGLVDLENFTCNAGIDKTRAGWKTRLPEPIDTDFRGERVTWNLQTNVGEIGIRLLPDVAPKHVTSTVYLTLLGFYDDVVFHRVIPEFMAQGGDPTGTGRGGPGYTIADEPVTASYGRGVVAMARTAEPNSVGSQFFIVLDDAARDVLASYNTYQIIGTVTSGMEAADAIHADADAEIPTSPVAMDSVTVSTP